MKSIALGSMISLVLFCVAATAQQTDPQQSAVPRSQSLSGEKTIVGCLERSPDGFAVRTETDVYPLNTERDLSDYVGKKVQLSQSWTAKGTVMASPMAGGTPQRGEAAAAVPKGRPGAFSGDFHLHVEGSVVGECTPKP
jgi:hypothetical protein